MADKMAVKTNLKEVKSEKKETIKGIDTGTLTVTGVRNRKIVDGVKIEVPCGQAYALLGDDSRAKRLIMRLAAANIKDAAIADDESKLCGLPISGKAAYVFDTDRLFSFMTCREYLIYGCSGLKMPKEKLILRVTGLLDAVSLSRRADVKISKLTDAEYMCLCVAFSLFNDSPLVLINADTLDYNKVNRETLDRLIFGLKMKNKAVLVNLSDPRMCGQSVDTAGILNGGKLVLQGRVKDLTSGDPKAYSIKDKSGPEALKEKLDEISERYDVKIRGVKKPTLSSVYKKAVGK